MSTPTPLKGTSQGRTPGQFPAASPSAAATPPGSTPFAANLGLTPRGQRTSPQAVKKSSQATPLPSSGNGRPGVANVDSPSAAAAMDAFGLQDLTLDSISNALAEAGGVPALKSDDEFATKLDAILASLRKYSWRLSEDGLEKYGRSFGFDCVWEDTVHNQRKTRTLVICGKVLQLEIAFENHIVVASKLEFPMSSELVRKHEAQAGEILYRGLWLPPTQSPFTKKLDRFAANFERLAAFDKFSSMPGLDFLEAPAGMHQSLEKLYRWDLARKRHDARYTGKHEGLAAKAVICQEHGRPVMNERDRVGLALQYWIEKHHVPITGDSEQAYVAKYHRVWSMLISCAPFNDMFYAPVRFTANWISDNVETFNPAPAAVAPLGGAMLDWLEPQHNPLEGPAAMSGTSIMQSDGSLSHEKYPSAMFVANFDPPIVLPQGISQRLHALLGVPTTDMWETYESLILPPPADSIHVPGGLRHEAITRYSMVYPQHGPGSDPPEPAVEIAICNVHITRGVYAHRLANVPFAHPRQLIEMMPVLRQYAFLATLMENSFGISITGPSSPQEQLDAEAAGDTWELHPKLDQQRLTKLANKSSPRWSFDVTVSVYPTPQIQITFPMPGGEPAVLAVEIRENGVPHILDQNVLPNDETGQPGVAARNSVNGKQLTIARLAKQLAVIEDIGLLCAWIRTRLG